MPNQLTFTVTRETDANGQIVPMAKAYLYQQGTMAPVTGYTDQTLTTAHPSPIVSDASGGWPTIWVSGTTGVKVVVTTAADVPVRTLDPDPGVSNSTTAASAISYIPTGALTSINVQSAINEVYGLISGGALYGLGVTGNAPLIASIDVTNIPSGFYRYDNTTTGTFPSGFAASDTGIMLFWRQNSGAGRMVIMPATAQRVFERQMTASVWGTYKEIISIPQGAANGATLQLASGVWASLAAGNQGAQLRLNDAGTALEWGGSRQLCVAEVQSSGTAGGTFTAGSYVTRVLNTTRTNNIVGASLASNQVTLPAGTYECFIWAPGYKCGLHKAKLYNVTDAADQIIGRATSSDGGGFSVTDAIVCGRFTIAATKVMEIRHRCGTTRATDGLGVPATFGDGEHYTTAIFYKVN